MTVVPGSSLIIRACFALAITIVISSCGKSPAVSGTPIRILMLSGSNNHEWQETTPVLRRMLESTDRFSVDVTLRPDTLGFDALRPYDVVLSNWNSWPDNDLRWPREAEAGLLSFVELGGGLVFFHASTSAFYSRPAFKEITTAAWIDSTFHGPKSPVRVTIDGSPHAITEALSDFRIFDELWIGAEQNPSFEVLASASEVGADAQGHAPQSAVFVSRHGEGRIFHTILGHDARALRNTGLQTLLKRGVEWAATGEVNTELPQELRREESEPAAGYRWQESDTTIALMKGTETVWQYNFKTHLGKPFFHPVYVDGNRLTCLSPDDHVWHLGQWFSWKFINGVNYWEYVGDTFESEGGTEIESIEIEKHPDFSADISLHIRYHPDDKPDVLHETRSIHVAPPGEDRIRMDYSMAFEPQIDSVVLGRTPIIGEPEGKSWGGYAGLSIRFNQDFMSPAWISASKMQADVNGTTDPWLYMGFDGPDGNRVGTAMYISDETRRDGEGWYLIRDESLPFYYFSPAILYLNPLNLKQGDRLHLAYRVMHLAGPATHAGLQAEFERYQRERDDQTR